ncbi:MAG: glutamate racemase [Candidatus Ratteibacteria bacterium]
MQSPIAVFDSGVGGLTVVKALQQKLPEEQIIYFGDTARIPYGTRSRTVVCHYAAQITEFLAGFNPKLIVIACHTVSSIALPFLTERFPDFSFIDVVTPSMEKALSITNGSIGVIGTPATVSSGRYEQLCTNASVSIHLTACPLFVPLVEEGWLQGPVPELVARHYLHSLLEKSIDTLILGCTHYPLLAPVIKKMAGPAITMIDTAEETGISAQHFLETNKIRTTTSAHPDPLLYFSDLPPYYRNVLSIFWQDTHVKIEECSSELFAEKMHQK